MGFCFRMLGSGCALDLLRNVTMGLVLELEFLERVICQLSIRPFSGTVLFNE